MRGTIDGIEVYLDEDQLPAFTLSVNSLTDPSKVQGVRSTTIRIVATQEARRVLGTEYMAQLPRSGKRPVLRIGDGDVDLFRAEVVPVKWTRDVIECIAVGGNASWFEYAKGVKLRDFDFGLGPASTEVAIQNTWTSGAYNDLYYPLVDYGSLEGRDDTYNVTASKFRPAVGVFHTMERLFALQGFELWPDASIVGSLLKLIALTPGKALVRRTQGDPATRVVYSEVPSIQYAITVVGSTPNVLTGLDTAPTFGASQWDGVNYAYTPVDDGRLVLMIANGFCRIYINPTYTTYIGRQIRMSLWDFTDGVEVAGVWSDKLTSLGFIDFGMEIGPKYVLAGHKIGIVWQVDAAVSHYDIEVVPFTCIYAPESEWVAGESPYINSLMPDMTLGELLTITTTLLDCVVLTNGKRITIKTWDAYMRSSIISGARDWSDRMDHSAAPEREYNAPAGVSFTFAKDNGDREVGRLDRVLGGEGFANARAVFDGVGNEISVSVKVSPTAMGECLGGCLIPLLRKDGGELDIDGVHYVDNFDRSTRMLMVDGMKAGTWTFGTTAKTSYPNCYFLRPDQRTRALHFANADIFSGPEVPGSTSTSWRRRLRMMGSGDILTAYFHLRDNELQDFDFGMPTLVDDGSGPAWYWVQEIKDHRFGAGLPTKVTLVKIPDVEYQPPANPPVEFPEPTEPFVCAGAGYLALTLDSAGFVNVVTGSGYFAVRGPGSSVTVYESNTDQGIGAGSFCVWPSNADGEKATNWQQLYVEGLTTTPDLQWLIGDALNSMSLQGDLGDMVIGANSIGQLSIFFDSPGTVDASELTGCIEFRVVGPVDVVSLSTMPTLESIVLDGCALTEETVNALIIAAFNSCNAGAPLTWLDLSGGTSAAPGASVSDELAVLTGTPGLIVGSTTVTALDGEYSPNGTINGRIAYLHDVNLLSEVFWTGSAWRAVHYASGGGIMQSSSDVPYPWMATGWTVVTGPGAPPTIISRGFGVAVTTN